MSRPTSAWQHTSRVQSHNGSDTQDAIPMLQIIGGWLQQFGFEVKQSLTVSVSERKIVIEVLEKD